MAIANGLKNVCLSSLPSFQPTNFLQSGIPCIVLERHPSIDLPNRDWNMGLHWAAETLRLLMSENRWNRLQSAQVDPSQPTAAEDFLKFINGQTGELINAIPANHFYRLRRRGLRQLLAPGIDIRYDLQPRTIEYTPDGTRVVTHLSNGESITAKLLIGADGARSDTRQLILDEESGALRRLPYCATFVQARYTAEQARFLRSFHPLYLGSINPAGYIGFIGMHDAEDPERPETWTFFFYISWQSALEEQDRTADWDNAQRLRQIKEFATAFTDPWKSAFEWLPEEHPVWYFPLTDFDPREESHRWDNHGGRVTLAGDAAHAMTFQRGQGLNHSMIDAIRLVEAIRTFVSGEKTQAEAVSRYEAEMTARAGAEVALSTANTRMVHDWETVLKSPLMTSGIKRTP